MGIPYKLIRAMTVEELKELVASIEGEYEKWERGELKDEPPITTMYDYALAMKRLRKAGVIPKNTWRYSRR